MTFPHLQVHGRVCATTKNCKPNVVKIYDSMRTGDLTMDAKESITTIMNSQNHCLYLQFPEVQQQTDCSSCGLFALAYAFDICDGIDPSMVDYSQVNLWSHFLSCLKKKSISSFGCGDVLYKPKSFTCRLRIFCLCRLGEDMVKCTTCHKWYHSTCVDIQLKAKVPGV